MSRKKSISLAATLASTVLFASFGLAQDREKSRDEALDKLLEKLDEAKTSAAAKSGSAESGKSKDAKKEGEVAPKDRELDSLLEKLGETPDTPTPDDPAKGGPGQGDIKPPGRSDKPKADDLTGKAKDLDEHLEELTGRVKKKKNGEGEGEGSGPMAKVIKEMRDVEERLGKTDTGEATRKKQTEIVKNLETLIEQLRNSPSQSQAKKKSLVMKPGSKQGSKPGENPGAMAQGVGKSKAEKPTDRHSLAGGKDDWGHLPAELRQEMMNVFKEEGLPGKAELIRRYYLSLSKKILIREE